MLIGYVSDERYSALCDVSVVLERDGRMTPARSLANGAILADVGPGSYDVTLAKDGFGSKRVRITAAEGAPFQFRLLSDRLLGYVWPKWTRAGGESEYRVHSATPYRLSIWRYGAEKELVHDFGWIDNHGPRTTIQITPDGDYVGGGVGWNRIGFGSVWHHQKVAAPERSGLYCFHAKNEGGEFFTFPWIVQPPKPTARVAVLLSNVTQNAYNPFGGRSNYVNQRELLPTPTVYSRTDLERYTSSNVWPFEEWGAPISFDRPEPAASIPEGAQLTDTIEGRLACAYAGGDWRLLGWLEREGFGYDLYSETELHFGRIPLDEYDVVVLTSHNEYGTPEMYFALKNWVHERGGKLMYLGGCAFLCEFEFLDEFTIRCRQEEKHDLRGESEACLLGVAYSHAGYRSAAPYRAIAADHWALANTGLKEGDVFGRHNVNGRAPGGASGLELDKISPHSPAGLVHLAKGMNPDDSGADMILYETASQGAVFSVGSMNWTTSLPVDPACSRITANVLRRFLS